MLSLTRKTDEAIMIGHNIRVTVTEIGQGRVRIGIDAPKDVLILRSELMPPDTKCVNCKEPVDAAGLCGTCSELAAEVKEGW